MDTIKFDPKTVKTVLWNPADDFYKEALGDFIPNEKQRQRFAYAKHLVQVHHMAEAHVTVENFRGTLLPVVETLSFPDSTGVVMKFRHRIQEDGRIGKKQIEIISPPERDVRS